MKTNIWKYGLFVLTAWTLASCGGRRSEVDLQQKLDSIRRLEQIEQLKLQGIELESANPFQMFFDSLAIQPLPLRSSADYVKYLPNFQEVPGEIFDMMGFEGRISPKAITLPETLGARLMLIASDATDGEHSLWIYSINDDYMPVDKLQLYKPRHKSETDLEQPMESGFSITSDYQICIFEYTSDNKIKSQKMFTIDASRCFVEDEVSGER